MSSAAAQKRFAVRLFQLAMLAWAASTSAAEYHVAPDGKESASGAAGSPWPLAKANAEAQPGDTTLLGGGEYASPIAPARSGAAGKPITYKAAPDAHPLITKL